MLGRKLEQNGASIGERRQFANLNRMFGLTEKMAYEQRSEGEEGGGHGQIWEKSIPGSRNSLCKGLGAGPWRQENSKEPFPPQFLEQSKGKRGRRESREVTGPGHPEDKEEHLMLTNVDSSVPTHSMAVAVDWPQYSFSTFSFKNRIRP